MNSNDVGDTSTGSANQTECPQDYDIDWEAKYDQSSFVYGTSPNAFVVEHIDEVAQKGAHILSVGEGEGRNAVWLAQKGFDVTALDYSANALTKLHRLADEAQVHVETICAKVNEFDFDKNRWDLILFLHIHLLPKHRQRVHRRAARGLKHHGVILLEVLSPRQLEQPTSCPAHEELLYTQKMLCEDFEGLLKIEHLVEEVRHIHAGEHRGPTSVVELIARRT